MYSAFCMELEVGRDDRILNLEDVCFHCKRVGDNKKLTNTQTAWTGASSVNLLRHQSSLRILFSFRLLEGCVTILPEGDTRGTADCIYCVRDKARHLTQSSHYQT
jgi:hypothetical protein